MSCVVVVQACANTNTTLRESFFFFFLSVIAIIGLFSVCLKCIFSFRMPVCMLPDINNTVKKELSHILVWILVTRWQKSLAFKMHEPDTISF